MIALFNSSASSVGIAQHPAGVLGLIIGRIARWSSLTIFDHMTELF